jgi:hypothetical protein
MRIRDKHPECATSGINTELLTQFCLDSAAEHGDALTEGGDLREGLSASQVRPSLHLSTYLRTG